MPPNAPISAVPTKNIFGDVGDGHRRKRPALPALTDRRPGCFDRQPMALRTDHIVRNLSMLTIWIYLVIAAAYVALAVAHGLGWG